jgi:hypothetical protein
MCFKTLFVKIREEYTSVEFSLHGDIGLISTVHRPRDFALLIIFIYLIFIHLLYC